MLENIFHIPRNVRFIIVIAFSLLIPISVGALIYVLAQQMGGDAVIASFSFVNLIVTGAGLAILVLFTQRSKSIALQLREIDIFLTREIPDQVRTAKVMFPNNVDDWKSNIDLKKNSKIKIEMLHFKSAPKCWYFVHFDSYQVAMYVAVTNYKMRTSFFVPRSDIKVEHFEETMKPFFDNAKSFGFVSAEIVDLPWTEADKFIVVQLSYEPRVGSLLDSAERLHTATIVSDLLRRFTLTCRKNKINLQYDRRDFF